MLNNEILPIDYTIYGRDRSSRGGGVLLCVNESIPSNLILSHSNLELITHNKSGILDLVFSNKHDLVGNVWVDTSWDKSDHYRVNFKISLYKYLTRSSSSTMLDFEHADFESMQDFFLDHDFSNFLRFVMWTSCDPT